MAKKIRLLSTYNNLPPNSIIMLDDATADKLLAGGVGATTDLTGGVVRHMDSDGSIASGQITAQQRVSISVPVGSALTVNGNAQAQGTLETLSPSGAVVSSKPLRSGLAGPLPGGKTYRVAVDFGTFQTSTQNVDDAYPQVPRFDTPVRVATWGDSLADTATADTHDLTRADVALWNSKDLRSARMAANMLMQSGGKLIPVANCGLGGTTSTQILARDNDPPGVNRRGAADAAALKAQVCVVSIGRNNILSAVRANTTASAQQAIFDTIIADTATAVKRVQRLGMYPILREFAGYGYEPVNYNYAHGAGLTAADVEVQRALMNRVHRHIMDVLVPTLGDMSVLWIRDGMVDENGVWLPQYSTDGLHENRNGGRVIGKRLSDLVLSMARPRDITSGYAPLTVGSGGVNAFPAPAMTTTVAAGRLTGFSDAQGTGATTRTWTITEDPDGTIWQNLTCVATAYDNAVKVGAPNGLSNITMNMALSLFGATPALDVKAGDLVRLEYDLIIDDGDGGIPRSVMSWYAGVAIGFPTGGSFFRVRSVELGNANGTLCAPDDVIAGKIVSLPLVMPADSAGLDNGLVQTALYLADSTPARIRVSKPRFVKWSNN
jgi:lysophospholipase L1-like esterase